MWKMSLLRNAFKSTSLIRVSHPNQGFSLLLRDSPRRFSTEAEQPTQDPPTDPFLQTPTTGLVYGRLFGITTHTTKSDILNLLEGCNLGLDDIKVDYNRSYAPTGMMIQFPSRNAYDAANRAIGRKGRLFRLERAGGGFDRTSWDLIAPYNGKAVLLQGIPRNALVDDVERFLSGCQYNCILNPDVCEAGIPRPH
ncbi:hypothetical protein F0562_017001 [Nyssa sinensis]|uniref:Uncharacterized protein n=1 Tax=Nyssa sinensis TaxID=561372 RepID=A0A5J4ZCY7_9ASTE|nr:hypothetical protein F0562_017001 [Nyssa sinensis]